MLSDLEAQYAGLLCKAGFRGPLCGACQVGYGRARMLECNPCYAKGTNTLYYLLIVLVNTVSLALTIRAAIMTSSGNAKPPGVSLSLRRGACVFLRLLARPTGRTSRARCRAKLGSDALRACRSSFVLPSAVHSQILKVRERDSVSVWALPS